MKTKCMSCGGSMSKHKVGGVITKKSTGGMYGIPQENLGGSSMKKGGATDSFKKLAPPYNKATYADKIAGAKKNASKKK